MKAETLKERPNYELYKQNDTVNFYYMQLPRWLIEDIKYTTLSLEAKFTYTLLFNRFQLSQHKGWTNENDEVFIIYTRKELSEKLNISEKRVSAAMKELKEYELVWERRCGRGFANQIYLGNIGQNEMAIPAKTNENTESGTENKEANHQNFQEEAVYPVDTEQVQNTSENMYREESKLSTSSVDNSVDKVQDNNIFASISSIACGTPFQEPSNERFLTGQNSSSKTADLEFQEPLNQHTSIIDFRFNEFNSNNQSQSESSPYSPTQWFSDAEIVEKLIGQSELEILDEKDAEVIKDAIERLYFMQSIKIGNAIYPKESIRANLWRLNPFIVEDTINKVTKNTKVVIRNSSAYVVTVLFNTIMESGSDLIVDPYLNFLRSNSKTAALKMGGG